MKTATRLPETEGAILARILQPEVGSLSVEAARALLELDFTPTDRQRMDELAEKASSGRLTSAERKDAEAFNRVGHLLALLQSKARQSLRSRKRG